MTVPLTLWQSHVQRWQDCRACELCSTRRKVVLAKGSLPCDVLFIGEAPGESENVVGVPFIGPAGHLLDRVIQQATPILREPVEQKKGKRTAEASWHERPMPLRFAFTNLVCCIPRDDDGSKLAEPSDESVTACSGRLRELVGMADPRLVVGVGRLAFEWLEPGYKRRIRLHADVTTDLSRMVGCCDNGKIGLVQITHPAAALRASLAQRGLMVRRMVVTLRNALEKLEQP